jgi:riboflavin synthase
MFTGLVETTGTLVRRTARGGEARLAIRGQLGGEPVVLGESIAIDGVCLTVDTLFDVGSEAATFEFDASAETLSRTTLGALELGAKVNLERALAVGARLGGHIVSGHVDGVGRVRSLTPSGVALGTPSASLEVVFDAPAELAGYIAPKGSICVSGVSLTINAVAASSFTVMLIPHTRHKTSLDALAVGSRVNLEVDVLARYVARLLEVSRTDSGGEADARLLERLRAAGYT